MAGEYLGLPLLDGRREFLYLGGRHEQDPARYRTSFRVSVAADGTTELREAFSNGHVEHYATPVPARELFEALAVRSAAGGYEVEWSAPQDGKEG